MSPSPKRTGSRFAPRSSPSLSPPSCSPTRSSVLTSSARPSLSAFSSASAQTTPPSSSSGTTRSASGPASTTAGIHTPGTVGGHAFRTVSAGTFRNNNPFAQRLQLAFMQSRIPTLTAGAGTGEEDTGHTTPVRRRDTDMQNVPSENGPGNAGLGLGKVSSSPIYDRERSKSLLGAPHTPPLHIVKTAAAKQRATDVNTPTPTDKNGVSGIPQPYTSRFGSASLFTPPPSNGAGNGDRPEAKMVSPTLEIPQPRSVTRSPGSPGGAGRTGSPMGITARQGSTSPSPEVLRKSRFINAQSNDQGKTTTPVSGLPNPSASTQIGNGKKKAGVQRKTVPALSPDTVHTSSIPRTRSSNGQQPTGTGNTARKVSPSTLSPPSFHQKNGRSMRQPSVPVLRGGGGSQAAAQAQGRKRASSVCSISTTSPEKASTSSVPAAKMLGGSLAPALPIVGRKDKVVEVMQSNVSPPHGRAETGDTKAGGGGKMTRSRSKSLVTKGSVSGNESASTATQKSGSCGAACQDARRAPTQFASDTADLGVPEHIRFRLRTLHQLSRVLGFDQSDVAKEIDIPGLLGRVDRAVEKHRDLLCHHDERADLRSHHTDDAFAKAVHVQPMPGAPSVSAMAEALKQDWSAELRRSGGAGDEDVTFLGSPLELLPSDAPLDVWPKGASAKSPTNVGMSSSASQRSMLEHDMSAGGRFGASPSLSFATFGLGLGVEDWNDDDKAEGAMEGDSPLLRLHQTVQAAAPGNKDKSKKKDWRAGMISRIKSLGRKSVDAGKTPNHSDSEDDEEFWEGQTDRKRKAATIGVWNVPAFGLALVDVPLDAWTGVHLDEESHQVPLAASLCITELWERGMSSPGLFRLAGSEDSVDWLHTTLNTPPFYGLGTDLSSSTPYTIAHSLKRFLRDLPEPILDESLLVPLWEWCCSPDFPSGGLASMTMHPAHTRRISAATLILRLLPPQHLSLFTYIMAFISHLQCATDNRLTLDAIAVVFGPAMLAPRGEGVPGVGAGTKGEKSDPVRVAMLVDQSQKCLAWLVRYWPVIQPDLRGVMQLPATTPVREAKQAKEARPKSPGSPRRGMAAELGPPVPAKKTLEVGEGRGNQSLDIPRPMAGLKPGKSGLSTSMSLSSFGLASSPPLSSDSVDKVTDKAKASRVSSPLAADTPSMIGGKLKSSGSTASGLGGGLRSALSNMNLSAVYKDHEDGGLKVPKRSASFNNLSAALKKGMGLGGKHEKRSKAQTSATSTPTDSPLLMTPSDSPDLGSTALSRSSLSCDGRPSSIFSTTSAANSQVSSVLGSLQDLLSSKDRQIERDARELAVLRHTLLEMNSKLSALSHAMPASPTKACGCAGKGKSGNESEEVDRSQQSPIITITQSPSAQLDSDTDELLADLRSQLDNALAALAVSRETTLTKDKQLVSIHQTLARHRAERLSETNKLESQLLIEVAKNKGLREERDLAKVRLEKVKHELFKVM